MDTAAAAKPSVADGRYSAKARAEGRGAGLAASGVVESKADDGGGFSPTQTRRADELHAAGKLAAAHSAEYGDVVYWDKR